MTEQDYERLVDRLAQRYERIIDEIALAAVEATKNEGSDFACDEAKAAVEVWLFGAPEWEKVEAVDISDLAYDAAQRAWSTQNAWGQA